MYPPRPAAGVINAGYWTFGLDLLLDLSRLEKDCADFNRDPDLVFFLWASLSLAEGSGGWWLLFVSSPNAGPDLDYSDRCGDLVGIP